MRALWLVLIPALAISIEAANLKWQAHDGYRVAPAIVPKGTTGFTQMTPSDTGINFTNFLSRDHSLTNTPSNNGSGVAAGDIDGDGWCDLYFCGLESRNTLYRNLGNWHFEDVTASSGINCSNQLSTGAVFADINGDGFPDLLVNGLGAGTRVFLNDGHGHFHEFTDEAGLRSKSAAMSLALADVDGDGDLDLYVTNYRTSTLIDELQTRFSLQRVNGKPEIVKVNGIPITAPELAGRYTIGPGGGPLEHGEADVLYLNDGKGHFTPVSWTGGAFLDEAGRPATIPYDWGLGVILRDLNGDGAPDIYVCNDSHSEDRIWINDGHGKFRAIARTAIRHTSLSSMGVDVADINRDGLDDFVVLDMFSRSPEKRLRDSEGIKWMPSPPGSITNRPQYPRNTLFVNRGDGTFAEIAALAGIESSEWSWTPTFLDVDLDGYEDLIITTGFPYDVRDADANEEIAQRKATAKLSILEQQRLRSLFPEYKSPPMGFRNNHDLTFTDAGKSWGFTEPGIAQGAALADLDNDGDLDLVVNRMNMAAAIYRNDCPAPRVNFRFPDARAIGARLKISGGPVTQTQEIICGGRYLSGDALMRTFACGAGHSIDAEVTWRNGVKTTITNIAANSIIEMRPIDGEASPRPQTAQRVPLFSDESASLSHVHQTVPVDDFAMQPLLPGSLSRQGPGLVWFDRSGAGRDDLIVAAGRGSKAGVFRNRGKGFGPSAHAALDALAGREQVASVMWREAGTTRGIVALSPYADKATNAPSLFAFGESDSVAPIAASVGINPTSLTAADVDGDGTLEVFVTGGANPGRYPEATRSMLLRQVGSEWKVDARNESVFANVGMANQAIFFDLDNDGDSDLVIACELGPIRVFVNNAGIFKEASSAWGTANRIGHWNSLAAGDFDGDGRLDGVAGNGGRNSLYAPSPEQPYHLYAADFDGNGTVEVVEATEQANRITPIRNFKSLRAAWPALQEQFATSAGFASATVGEILGDDILKRAAHITATYGDTIVLLNRGTNFEVQTLPVEAQFSVTYGIVVADFNGDGKEDIFLAQNNFGTRTDEPRQDASRGLILTGNGHGQFKALPTTVSGVKIDGEQRGAATSDYDDDGRPDLAVGQHSAATILLHNLGAKPGLSVRLQGAGGNQSAIGATIRLKYTSRLGPARLVGAGSGYRSQNSFTQVIGFDERPVAIMVTWPDGKVTESKLPAESMAVEISTDGALRVIR